MYITPAKWTCATFTTADLLISDPALRCTSSLSGRIYLPSGGDKLPGCGSCTCCQPGERECVGDCGTVGGTVVFFTGTGMEGHVRMGSRVRILSFWVHHQVVWGTMVVVNEATAMGLRLIAGFRLINVLHHMNIF